MALLKRISVKQKSGDEFFHADGVSVNFDLLGFWRWSTSDLVSNAIRGRLAEYLVARALGIDTNGVRNEWDAFDLQTETGIKIEVKSASYIQSWHQSKLSEIIFRVPPTHAFDPENNQMSMNSKRQADIYIFALLACQNKKEIDPLNIMQWRFYMLPAEILNSRTRSQHSITLRSLEAIAKGPVLFRELRDALIPYTKDV